jgi:hypothetical protein
MRRAAAARTPFVSRKIAFLSVQILEAPIPSRSTKWVIDLASSIIGVWRYTSFLDKEVQSGNVLKPFGENPSGYIVYTSGGHIVFLLVGDRSVPASPNPTDAERIACSALCALAPAYIYIRSKVMALSINWDASWSQWWTGRTQKRKVEIEGNKMTITSAPTKSVATGREIIFIITLSLHSKELNNTTGTAHCTLAMRIACKEQWGRV